MLSSLPLYLGAGLVNGSFATPTKYMKNWRFENIWLQHSLWAFIILPWLTILFLAPQILAVYHTASFKMMSFTLLGGLVFGIGQVASALAIYIIGIGLTFVICIGVSTVLGFLLPLIIQHPDKIMTPFGLVTLGSTLLAIFGFIVSTYAGKQRSKNSETEKANELLPRFYFAGVFLALLAGLFSAGQNICFALTGSLQTIAIDMGATQLGAAMIMWPGFLTVAFIPYAFYMIFLMNKNDSFTNYRSSNASKYYLLAFLMGLFWFSSLMFYSKACQLGGSMGPIIGWPIFMVIIILTSNLWSWLHKEWKGSGRKTLLSLFISLSLMVMSMIMLGISSALV
jgi:L-rhamnose-H+ transport protein